MTIGMLIHKSLFYSKPRKLLHPGDDKKQTCAVEIIG